MQIIRSHAVVLLISYLFFIIFIAPGAVGHLSFTDILDTSLKVSWKEPQEKNGVLTGNCVMLTCLLPIYESPKCVFCP